MSERPFLATVGIFAALRTAIRYRCCKVKQQHVSFVKHLLARATLAPSSAFISRTRVLVVRSRARDLIVVKPEWPSGCASDRQSSLSDSFGTPSRRLWPPQFPSENRFDADRFADCLVYGDAAPWCPPPP